jgi:hypothetical protein
MGLIEHGDIGVAIPAKTVVNSRPLSMRANFLGSCFDHSERMPDEIQSGFFVGRVCLKK